MTGKRKLFRLKLVSYFPDCLQFASVCVIIDLREKRVLLECGRDVGHPGGNLRPYKMKNVTAFFTPSAPGNVSFRLKINLEMETPASLSGTTAVIPRNLCSAREWKLSFFGIDNFRVVELVLEMSEMLIRLGRGSVTCAK